MEVIRKTVAGDQNGRKIQETAFWDFFWLDFDLVVLLILYCQGFFGHSQLVEGTGGGGVELFGTIPCNSFIWPSINLKLGASIGMSRKYSHTKIAELFLEMTSQWCNFLFLQLLCFLFDFAQILHRDASWYNKQNYKILLRLIEKWRHKTSSLILRTRFGKYPSKNVLPWQYEALYLLNFCA